MGRRIRNGDAVVTAKIDADGAIVWRSEFLVSDVSLENPVGIASDRKGGAYVVAYSDFADTGRDYVTLKYDAEGNEQWMRRYNGWEDGNDYPIALAVDAFGNVTVTGESEGAIGSREGYRDYATVQYDAEGTMHMEARYNGPGNRSDIPTDLALDIEGNAIVTGYSSLSFSGESFVWLFNAVSRTFKYESSAPLPIELTSFKAAVTQEKSIRLQWETASETRNVGFEIQRKRRSDTWQHVAFVEGGGTTTEPRSYTYTVENVALGKHVFRLKQVDQDGTASFIREVGISNILDEAYRLSMPYPNPASASATVELGLETDQFVRIMIYDVLGRRVNLLHQGELASQQMHEFQVDATRLPSGTYFVQVEGETFMDIRRFTVVR